MVAAGAVDRHNGGTWKQRLATGEPHLTMAQSCLLPLVMLPPFSHQQAHGSSCSWRTATAGGLCLHQQHPVAHSSDGSSGGGRLQAHGSTWPPSAPAAPGRRQQHQQCLTPSTSTWRTAAPAAVVLHDQQQLLHGTLVASAARGQQQLEHFSKC
ncbi:unnamed protein product [Closterium sp. Naga37s-1]|nr:unnamed protein product [Closterium sp. Naga37s-1]